MSYRPVERPAKKPISEGIFCDGCEALVCTTRLRLPEARREEILEAKAAKAICSTRRGDFGTTHTCMVCMRRAFGLPPRSPPKKGLAKPRRPLQDGQACLPPLPLLERLDG